MCEFMACGRPVIASHAHGHKDVLGPGAMLLASGALDPAGWFNPSVSDILYHLEWCYANRDKLADLGQQCRKNVEHLTWRACAEKIYKAAYGA
jgi:glycosyltransferase involved in cell wall biosynthesis